MDVKIEKFKNLIEESKILEVKMAFIIKNMIILQKKY